MEKKYTEAVGRRKTAVARVRMTPAAKTTITVGEKTLQEYFGISELIRVVNEPLEKLEDAAKTYLITVKVSGGGIHAQAEAIRHGISRVLVMEDETVKATLKKFGFIKRDPRAKERRKFGLRKARKAPQWSKR